MMKFLSTAPPPPLSDRHSPSHVQSVKDTDADKENNHSTDNMIEDVTVNSSKKRSREGAPDIVDLTPMSTKHSRTDPTVDTAAVEQTDRPVELIDVLTGQYQWHKQALSFADELSNELLEQYTQLMQSISTELTATHHSDTVTGKRQRKQSAVTAAQPSTDNAVCILNDVTCAVPRGRYAITITLSHIILQPKTSTGQPAAFALDVNNIAVIQSRDMYLALTFKTGETVVLKYGATAKAKPGEIDVPHSDHADVSSAQQLIKDAANSPQLQHQVVLLILQQLTHTTTAETHDKSVFTSVASNKLTPSGVSCYCKTRDGILHCYKSGLYFISTVPLCMPAQKIASVELNAATSSTVDVVVTMTDQQKYEFTQISKNESQRLDEYFAMMNKQIAKHATASANGAGADANAADSDDSDASDSDFEESSDDSSSDVSEEYDSSIDGEAISSSADSGDDNAGASQSSSDTEASDAGDNDSLPDDSDGGVDIDRFVAE